jgi:hypothetical protein
VAASRRLYRETTQLREGLAAIGGELKRIRAPVCRVMEAGALLKYFDVAGSLPPEAAAAALL